MLHQAKNIVIRNSQFTIAANNHDAVSTILWPHVAAGAIFDSAERYAAGKCHPQTRQKVIDQMTTWIKDANPPKRILWMYGLAGAGKSALMQSLCELLRDSYPGLNGGSFFFAKGDMVRGNATKLFVTLSYQLAIQFPPMRAAINDALTQDPSLPTKSMEIQLRYLIINPLLRCQEFPKITPTLFIDGLDECDGDFTQRQIVTLISESIIEHDIPIRFVIASRPEYLIRYRFETSPLPDITYPLSLRDDVDADKDINAYLTDGFERIRQDNRRIMGSVELPWPPEHIIDRFVYEASGQYIYASTILKFVGNETLFNDPQEQLEILLNSGPDRGPAFTELDRLYQTVLSVYPRREQMKRVLAGLLMNVNLTVIRVLLGVPQKEITLVLDALSSLIDITPPQPLSEYGQLLSPVFGSSLKDEEISFCHLSFHEFLQDKARSGSYHVDVPAIHAEAINAFFAVIQRSLDKNYEIEPHLLCNTSLSEYHRMMKSIVGVRPSESSDFLNLLPALNGMMERFRRFDPFRRMNYPACFMRDMDFLSHFLHTLESESSIAAARNPSDLKQHVSDSMDSVRDISTRLQKITSMARKIGIRLLSLCDEFTITHTLFFIRFLGQDYFHEVTFDALLKIPGTNVADTLSTILRHRHIIELWPDGSYDQSSIVLQLVDLGKSVDDVELYWPDWSNDGAHIDLKATIDEGWLSRGEWANQRVSFVCEFLKSFMTHLDNDWEHIYTTTTPRGMNRDLKYPIFASFLNDGDISDIRGKEYFQNKYHLSLLKVMVDAEAWMSVIPLRKKLWTDLDSLITPVLSWFDRQLTHPTAVTLMEEHDVFFSQKLTTAMKCIFQHCFIPIFKTPYFSDLLISTFPEESESTKRKTIRIKVLQSNILDEETDFIPSEDHFFFSVPDFLTRSDPPPPIPTSEWYPCLAAYILNLTVKDLYRETHPEFGQEKIRKSSLFRRPGENPSAFIYVFQCLQYALTTPQNLDALRAIKYLSEKLFFWSPLPEFCYATRMFLKSYARLGLSSEEMSEFELWFQNIEKVDRQIGTGRNTIKGDPHPSSTLKLRSIPADPAGPPNGRYYLLVQPREPSPGGYSHTPSYSDHLPPHPTGHSPSSGYPRDSDPAPQLEEPSSTIRNPGPTKGFPGPQIPTGEGAASSIPIQNDALHVMVTVDGEKSENFDATTCWIAAEQALHHVRSKASDLANIFSRRNIPQSEYAVHAGFDESLIRAGVGYLEQIHIFVSEKVDPASDLLLELEGIFLPFSSILFTQSSSHPVSLPKNIRNPWECGELPPPTVISLASQTPSTVAGPSGFSQGSSGNGKGGANEKRSSEKGKERDDGDPKNFDKAGNNDQDPQGVSRPGDKTDCDPTISFEINSEIRSIVDSDEPVQTLTMQGALTIKTTSLDSQAHERRIRFEELKFDADPTGMEYKQSFVKVSVNSHSKISRSKGIKPWSTPGYDRKEKESSTTTNTKASAWSVGFNPGPHPTGSVAYSSTQTRAVAMGLEKQRNTSRISQQGRSGSVRWIFRIDDPSEQEEGMKMQVDSDILPTVTFEFYGSSDLPTTIPERTDIEIVSCWSLIPDSPAPKPSNWFLDILRKFFRPSDGIQTPSYSNLCQITALETIPSALPQQSRYVATLYPVREITGYSHLTRDNIEVLHDIGPSVVVKPDLNSDYLSVIQHTGPLAVVQSNPNSPSEKEKDCAKTTKSNKKITFKLPSITKVKLPDNPEQALENTGSSTKSR